MELTGDAGIGMPLGGDDRHMELMQRTQEP